MLDAGFQPHPQTLVNFDCRWMLPVAFQILLGEMRTYNTNVTAGKIPVQADERVEIHKLLVESNCFSWLKKGNTSSAYDLCAPLADLLHQVKVGLKGWGRDACNALWEIKQKA